MGNRETSPRGVGVAAPQRPYHAGAAAVVAMLQFGSRLIPLAVTALTGIHDVHSELLVDALGSLIEGQFHDVLKGMGCHSAVSGQEGPGQYL